MLIVLNCWIQAVTNSGRTNLLSSPLPSSFVCLCLNLTGPPTGVGLDLTLSFISPSILQLLCSFWDGGWTAEVRIPFSYHNGHYSFGSSASWWFLCDRWLWWGSIMLILYIRIILTLCDMDSGCYLYPSSQESLNIDIIFHVHCTKPVWCMTVGGFCSIPLPSQLLAPSALGSFSWSSSPLPVDKI